MKSGRRRRTVSRGRWQVTRERCRIESRQPPPPDAGDCRLGDVIAELVRSLDLDRHQDLQLLAQEWPQLVGGAVAAHTRPGSLNNRILEVFVDNSVWLNELSRYGRGAMLQKLQARLGPARIAAVALRPDPDR